MTAEQYRKLSEPFRRSERTKKALTAGSVAITLLLSAAYIAETIAFFITNDERLWRVFFVPAAAFLFVSLLRKIINRPRPYETLQTEPISPKRTKGKSFPSRHAFCAGIVSVALFYASPIAGIVAFFLGMVLCFFRVAAGMHYPSDVIFGLIFGTVITALGIYLP